MNKKKLTIIGITAILAILLGVATAMAADPYIVTDKADYDPNETVKVIGSGFAANTTYAIPVERPDGTYVIGDGTFTEGWDTVSSDINGDIYYEYILNGIEGLYTVYVYNLPWDGPGTGTPIATTTFVDAPPGSPKIEQLYQWANGTDTKLPEWQFGNLNANNSLYYEGDTVPYYTNFTGLTPGVVYFVTIEWDTSEGSQHALDYINSYLATESTTNPCSDEVVPPTCTPPDSTFSIPQDTIMMSDPDWHGTPEAGTFTIWNGTIDSTSGYTLYGALGTVTEPDTTTCSSGGCYDGNTRTSISIHFTAGASDVVLAWGGHIASRPNWGSGNVAPTGSPFHMRITDFFDVTNDAQLNVGQMDRSLKKEAVIFPSSITIVKVAEPEGDTIFNFTASPTPLYDFPLTDNGTPTDRITFSGITDFQTYTVSELVPGGWSLDNIFCQVDITADPGEDTTFDISNPTVGIDLAEGEDVTCTYHDSLQTGTIIINKVTNPTGGTGFDFTDNILDPYSFSLDDGGTETFVDVMSGTYMVTEADKAGWVLDRIECTDPSGGTAVTEPTAYIDLAPGETVECTYYNYAPDFEVIKTGPDLSKAGDEVTYTYTINNLSPSGTPNLELISISDDKVGNLYTEAVDAGCGSLPPAGSCTFAVAYTIPEGTTEDPFVNTVTVVMSPVGSIKEFTDSDDHTVNLFQPGVEVIKTGDTLSKVGDEVTYNFTINNTSSIDSPNLILASVIDTGDNNNGAGLGDLTATASANGCGSLAPGGSCSFSVPYTVLAGDDDPLDNRVDVLYHPDGFPNDITDWDDHSVDLFQPSVTIDKTGDDLSKVGDPVNYTITVVNTSSPDSPNLTCDITDPLLGIAKNVNLAPGASDVTNASRIVQPGDPDPLVNTASVTCTVDGFGNVIGPESDSHPVELFQPGVEVTKTGDTLGKVDDPVDYTITINNLSSGDSPDLVNGTIVDTLLGDLLDGANPYVTSSTCADVLPTGGSCVIEATRIAQAGDPDPLPNTVEVHYNPEGFPNDITDWDDHSVNLFQPSVTIDKTGDPYSKVGDTVTYWVTIQNTSSDDSPNLVLDSFSDSLVPGVTPPTECDEMAPSESCSFSYTYVVQAGDDSGEKGALMWNTATAHYHPFDFPNDIWDASSWSVELVHPDYTLTKTCTTPWVAPEANATFDVVFTNTGDVNLLIEADENLYWGATLVVPAGTKFNLLEGATQTYQVYVTAGYEETVPNTINATATLPPAYGLANELDRTSSDYCEVYGRIIVEKVVIYPISTEQLFPFEASFYDFDLRNGEQEDTGWTLFPGTHWVNEIVPDNWFLVSAVCDNGDDPGDITLHGGETVTCTFTNQWWFLGYTPGFWKNHGETAPSGNNAWQYTAYTEGERVGDIFDAAYLGESSKHTGLTFADQTLMDALRFKGGEGNSGAVEILMRAGVAAMLNASFSDLNYDMWTTEPYNLSFGKYAVILPGETELTVVSAADVISLTNTALSTEDRETMLALAKAFDDANNFGSEYFNWDWPLP